MVNKNCGQALKVYSQSVRSNHSSWIFGLVWRSRHTFCPSVCSRSFLVKHRCRWSLNVNDGVLFNNA